MMSQKFLKNVLTAIVFMSIFGGAYAHISLCHDKAESVKESDSISEGQLIKKAWQKIQKTINEEGSSRKGSPKKMYVEYKLAGDDLVLENEKVYFSGYRAQPEYKTNIHSDDLSPDKVIKVVYKKNDDKLSVTERDLKENQADTKEVTIHSLLA